MQSILTDKEEDIVKTAIKVIATAVLLCIYTYLRFRFICNPHFGVVNIGSILTGAAIAAIPIFRYIFDKLLIRRDKSGIT